MALRFLSARPAVHAVSLQRSGMRRGLDLRKPPRLVEDVLLKGHRCNTGVGSSPGTGPSTAALCGGDGSSSHLARVEMAPFILPR